MPDQTPDDGSPHWLLFWLSAAIAALVIGAPAVLVLLFAFFAGERWDQWRPTAMRWLKDRT